MGTVTAMTAPSSLAVVMLLLATACASPDPGTPGASPSAVDAGERTEGARDAAVPDHGVASRTASLPSRPDWLGTRELPLRPDGFGEVQPTPPELRDRRLPPPDLDVVPLVGDGFVSEISPVPGDVVERTTWTPACPVTLGQLRYLRLTFWGFDGRPHTGEMLVHRDAATSIVDVFRQLYAARFPIEEMRAVTPAELDAPATGDGNNTTAFVCRPTRGSSRWSQHAYGLAVDVNPFHNPYERGDLVLPELASAYTDRAWERPGMVLSDGPVVEAFDAIGWGWGGDWTGSTDPMHFSSNGR